ncbi:Transmembrane amino acid transporter protein [Tritrichomonas foetus]|uniref:Transmembrane amino acid transporter protein n=1 Tax=Tritrichomonas foetus TaxID=1144522 RepID=A0A1J4KKQ9_9EUKA|nr:Transmembrane amino acid transporter protein [Tritrichomonas foetus]|eukprot:OHT09957.1 Transmembrane amino acid transporter protein [Tritrichomonas foetus]
MDDNVEFHQVSSNDEHSSNSNNDTTQDVEQIYQSGDGNSQKNSCSELSSDSDKDVTKVGDDISLFRAVILLLNIIIGVGLLSIPYCFKTGVILNSLVIFFIGLFALISFIFLIDASITSHITNYSILIRAAFEKNFEWIPNTLNVLTMFGVGILHLQYSCSMMQTFFDELKTWMTIPEWCYNRWFLISLPAFVIDLPLMLLRSISGLSYVSMFTVVLIGVHLIHSTYFFGDSLYRDGFDPNKEIKYFELNQYVIPSLSMQAFSFTCHPVFFPTMNKLRKPTRKRQYTLITIVIIIAGFTYFIGGLLPYLTKFEQINSAIVFAAYTEGHPFTIIMKILYGVFLLVTTPLILYACRTSLNDLVFRTAFTTIRYYVMGIAILILATILAVTVESIPTMFGFVGGVTCTLLVYVLPSVYYIRICKKESRIKTAIAWLMIPIGIALLSVCLYDSIRSLI